MNDIQKFDINYVDDDAFIIIIGSSKSDIAKKILENKKNIMEGGYIFSWAEGYDNGNGNCKIEIYKTPTDDIIDAIVDKVLIEKKKTFMLIDNSCTDVKSKCMYNIYYNNRHLRMMCILAIQYNIIGNFIMKHAKYVFLCNCRSMKENGEIKEIWRTLCENFIGFNNFLELVDKYIFGNECGYLVIDYNDKKIWWL